MQKERRELTNLGKRNARLWDNKRRKTGVTKLRWSILYATQNGLCALCDFDFSDHPTGAHIDHNHTTGAVRGLLCLSCNTSMASADKPGWLARAAAYKVKYDGYP